MTAADEADSLELVLEAYGWRGRVDALGSGLINDTYRVSVAGEPVAVLQRLHPVFDPSVNLDLEAVTAHVRARGLETPLLIRTRAGRPWVELGGRTWRAISYLDGETRERVGSTEMAASAGALVARFHRALRDFDYTYQSVRAGVHDTEAHLAKLARLAAKPPQACAEDVALAQQILAAAAELVKKPSGLPRRHAHGDLKISNVLFERGGPRARCLIDLDTCGRLELAYELGDMLRSWCNPRGEDTGGPSLDRDLFTAALDGYASVGRALLCPSEVDAIVWGLQTICVELAARFAADVFEDRYFGWDAARFPSRRAHNRLRAQGQLSLARLVAKQAPKLHEITRRAFA
jgi:Ser/Thr protein kinase RdoA (MazF antagonist)